jgi:hypothetical protein
MADFDLDKFLADVELEEGEKDTARKIFARTKNQGMVLRQSEFDRKMNAGKADLQKLQADVEAKQAVYDKLVNENLNYKGTVDSAFEKYKKSAELDLQKATSKAIKAAELAGITLDDIDDEILPAAKNRKQDVDVAELRKGLVSNDDLNRLATGQVNLLLALDEIKDTHEELMGKKMSTPQKNELLTEFAKDVGRNGNNWTLMQTADRLFEFSDKRQDLSKAQLKKLETEAEQRGYQKAMQERSDAGLPAPRRAADMPIFFKKSENQPEKASSRNRVAAAMEAVNKSRMAS